MKKNIFTLVITLILTFIIAYTPKDKVIINKVNANKYSAPTNQSISISLNLNNVDENWVFTKVYYTGSLGTDINTLFKQTDPKTIQAYPAVLIDGHPADMNNKTAIDSLLKSGVANVAVPYKYFAEFLKITTKFISIDKVEFAEHVFSKITENSFFMDDYGYEYKKGKDAITITGSSDAISQIYKLSSSKSKIASNNWGTSDINLMYNEPIDGPNMALNLDTVNFKTNTWPNGYASEIGLLTVDDYNNAANNGNWLFTGTREWTMTPSGNLEYYIDSSGAVKTSGVSSKYGIRPVFYMDINVDNLTGKGTATDPYRINTGN